MKSLRDAISSRGSRVAIREHDGDRLIGLSAIQFAEHLLVVVEGVRHHGERVTIEPDAYAVHPLAVTIVLHESDERPLFRTPEPFTVARAFYVGELDDERLDVRFRGRSRSVSILKPGEPLDIEHLEELDPVASLICECEVFPGLVALDAIEFSVSEHRSGGRTIS